jgi:general secretion pathway protein F/type IV pilus assembly protein PilC
MASFQYIAVTTSGERVAGVLAGGNEQAILAELDSRRLTPISVHEVQDKQAGVVRRRVSARALATNYVQMADLLRAGVPLLRALRLMGGRKSNPTLAKVFAELADAVADGTELAEAMAARPDVFSRVHVAMVRAGEKGGFLEQVLGRLGAFQLAQSDLRAKVIGSMIYPSVLVVVGTGILGLIFAVFIPKFEPIFEKVQLGTLTKTVLAVSHVVSGYWMFLAAGIVIVGVGAWRGMKNPRVRREADRRKFAIPIVGPILRAFAVARFCRILGTMLSNSIPMITAMQISKEAAGSVVMEEAIVSATEAVKQGQLLAPPLQSSGLFSDDVLEMIAVGESANNLDDVLVSVADTLEQRLERQLSGAVKLIEPLLLMLMASVVGLVALSLVLPMTKLASGVE